MAKQKPNPEPQGPESPAYNPMSGPEFLFVRKFFNQTQVDMTKPLSYTHYRSIMILERMSEIPSGRLVNFEKFITARFTKAEFEKARALFKSETPKARERITQGEKSKEQKQQAQKPKKNRHRYKAF